MMQGYFPAASMGHCLHPTCLNCFAAVGGRRPNGVTVEPIPGCSAPHFTTAVPETLTSDMAFQINLANEAAWAKEIAGSQSGAIQGQDVCISGCSSG